jgi:hypothetical protein
VGASLLIAIQTRKSTRDVEASDTLLADTTKTVVDALR